MPRRTTPLVAEEYYHLYNRGTNRELIFFSRENYLFFLKRVRLYLLGETPAQTSEVPPAQTSEVSKTSEVWAGTSIIAYCLMPNHYHLLVQPHHGDLSHQMQLFGISYTKAINNQEARVGPLFQGQFRAVHVNRDEYLLHLSRYIHLNPVAAGLVKRPEDWEFSSYREYIGSRSGTLPDPQPVLTLFPDREAYRQFVNADISDDNIEHLLLDES